ncbi:unnamed protein product [Aphanomyces euteiches]|uniref:Cyclic nucleotide-binding domain-containing protein n=1 Tax=Aphanomyces euteiches TaxID=100861 RepID=A0A6G0XTU0_9STRA|nr:hypothetical protein Ae201684_001488 [Aphanomyces euteiches]KAH9075104.1 hypothetical protein Ae201684P_003789 [Aphanomyces euteiches]KAH9144301.1 hypothetical protein AeRB84_011754 [Aphanomyces euteiches]
MKKAKGKIEFCAKSLQAKFALRRMYMSGTDLSQQQLEFVVDFLERETVIHRMSWWQRLKHTERLALAKDIKLKYIYKGEHTSLLNADLQLAYVILRGSADGFILDRPNQVPVHMRDGSVFGTLHFANSVHSATDHVGWVGNIASQLKHKFQKVILRGPCDCLVLTAATIVQSASAVAHVTNDHCLDLFGMAALAPYARFRTYEPGMNIVRQGDSKSNFYIIVKGTAKATFRDDSVPTPAPSYSSLHKPSDEPPPPKPQKLDVALLGPQSYVGDIASIFDVPEPVTVKCTSTVNVVYFLLDELFEALRTHGNIHKRMKCVAFHTLEFLIEQLEQLFGVTWTAKSATQNLLTTTAANFKVSPLPPLDDIEDHDKTDYKDENASPAGSPTTRNDATKKNAKSSKRRGRPRSNQSNESPPSPLFQNVHVDTTGMAPIVPTKEMILAMHSMHSSFRQKSAAVILDSQPHDIHVSPPASFVLPACKPPSKMHDIHETTDLFLFPTMTKQRQYHGRSLPLLQKCQGIETPYSRPPHK